MLLTVWIKLNYYDGVTFHVWKNKEIHYKKKTKQNNSINTLLTEHNWMTWVNISVIIRKIFQLKPDHMGKDTISSFQELVDAQIYYEKLVIVIVKLVKSTGLYFHHTLPKRFKYQHWVSQKEIVTGLFRRIQKEVWTKRILKDLPWL